MNGCWKYCYGHEERLAQDIADIVHISGLHGVDFNVEEQPDHELFSFLETLTIETHQALASKNPRRKWILSHSPLAHFMDIINDSAEKVYFQALDYTTLLQRLDEKGYLSFVFVQYYNSWPVASTKNNALFESFVGHTARLQRIFHPSKLVLGMCTGGCQETSLVRDNEAAVVWHNHRYYSGDLSFAGVGIWAMTNPGTEAVVDGLVSAFRDPLPILPIVAPVDPAANTAAVQGLATSDTALLILVIFLAIGLLAFVLIFSSETTSLTWDMHNQEKTIGQKLPGSIAVFIPLCSESTDEVMRTCSNFKESTLSNSFLRDEVKLFFIVDNDRSCDGAKAILQAATSVDLETEQSQLSTPYRSGMIHGIFFKMFFKGETRQRKGKRHSALLFANLVKDDENNGNIEKAWMALCLDGDVVTFPNSIEQLIIHILQDDSIIVTCGSIFPAVGQKSLASRVQAAEYFFQTRGEFFGGKGIIIRNIRHYFLQ